MQFEVNHICATLGGGAGIAARRLHDACVASDVMSRMTVMQGQGDSRIELFTPKRTLRRTLQRELARHLRKRLETQESGLMSIALAESGLAESLNRSEREIVNLHWVNSDMLSIAEIGRLQHPVVWTLHDMWPFCGAEHYTEGAGWKAGYNGTGRALHRWVWQRKARHWKHPFHIVTPSHWLAQCARQSALMQDWPVHVIPNAIDTELWAPMPREKARARLDLPPDEPLVLFGAMGGGSDPRKGFEPLRDALLRLHSQGRALHLLVFGGQEDMNLPFKVHQPGQVNDPETLRAIYSAADVFALPSRQDNLPNTGVEALACGTPIVGFDIGGLPDLVTGPDLGYLARPFDTESLAHGLGVVLDRQLSEREERKTSMAVATRTYAVNSFSSPIVARQYKALYEEVWTRG